MSSFVFLQNSLRDPYLQLAWEEAIALEMPLHGMDYGVRIWKNHKTIVLGISEKETDTINHDSLTRFKNNRNTLVDRRIRHSKDLLEEEFFIARRASGGGTVFQSIPENINYSLFVDITNKKNLYPIKESYEILLGIVRAALKKMGLDSHSAGKSDISIDSGGGVLKKISGNAQFRKRNIICQHGTLILDTNIIDEIEKHQSHPPEEPDYRKKRSHRDFLTSIPFSFREEIFCKYLMEGLDELYDEDKKIHFENENVSIHGLGEVIDSKIQKKIAEWKFLKKSLRRRKALRESKYSLGEWIFKSN